jgi:Bacterial SH3 domain
MQDDWPRDLQKAIRDLQMADPFKGLREAITGIQMADPLKGMREAIAGIQMADPFKGLREAITAVQIADPLKGMREAIAGIQMADPFKGLREAVTAVQMADPLKGMREAMNVLQNLQIRIDFDRLNRSYTLYREVFRESVPTNSLEEAYLQVVAKVIEAASKNDSDEALSVVAGEMKRDASIAPNTLSSIQFYICLFVAFMIFLCQNHLSEESDKKVMAELVYTRTVITEKLDAIMSARANEVYFVVARPVNLRSESTTKNRNVIKMLYPNQIVRLIEERGKWIKVESFTSGVHESGWCYGNRLKRLHNQP